MELSIPRCGIDAPLLLAIIKTLSSESSEGSLIICRIYTGNHSPLPQATVDKRPFARVVFPNNPAFGIAAPGPSDTLDLREKSPKNPMMPLEPVTLKEATSSSTDFAARLRRA